MTPKPRATRQPGAGVSEELSKKITEIFASAGLKPRPLQLQVAIELVRQLDSSPVGVGLEAPPGFGKTLTVLASFILSDVFPIIWRVRTYPLAKHIAEQCSLLNLRYFVVAGREKMCLMKHEGMHYLCRYLRHKCPYFGAISQVPDDVFDYAELRERIHNICPYYAQLAIRAQVYIGVYKLGLPLPRQIEVLDEAHNIVGVKSLPLSVVYDALKEIQMPKNYLDRIVEHPRAFSEEILPIVLKYIDEGKKLFVAPKLFTMFSNVEVAWIDGSELYFVERYIPRVRAVFISATLSPFAEIFRIPIIRVPVYRTRRAYVTTWLTTQFWEYDIAMAQRYNDLLFLLRKYCRKILVFATERVATLIHYDFYEDDLDMDTLKNDWSGVLLFKARGRRAEGVDVHADCVVIAGVPYLPPYARVEKVGLTRDVAAIITTIQNVGRALRSPDADPVIVLADERFLRLPLYNYFQLREVHDLPELDRLLKEKQQTQTNKK